MDLKELKKLINEEIERKKLNEQSEEKPDIHPEDVILTLIHSSDSLPLSENSAIQSAISNIDMKMKLAKTRIATFNKYIPHSAREITMQEVYSSLKNDPAIMNTILEFLNSMGATESLITNFKNNALSELEKFNVQQPKTNPGTPAAKLDQPVDPKANTQTPGVNALLAQARKQVGSQKTSRKNLA